jgi:hypothetical protein
MQRRSGETRAHLGGAVQTAEDGDRGAWQQLVVHVGEYEPRISDGHRRRALAAQQHRREAAVCSAGAAA